MDLHNLEPQRKPRKDKLQGVPSISYNSALKTESREVVKRRQRKESGEVALPLHQGLILEHAIGTSRVNHIVFIR